MYKITRLTEPDFLAENAPKWNRTFAENRAKNSKFAFQWAMHKGKRANVLLLPFLQKMSQNHCAFCDGYPFSMSKETIEHFRPKSRYPHLAYTWENLFLCCDACQSAKLEYFSPLLLKPDEIGYSFEDYFQCNFKTGELQPNPTKSWGNQLRALITIRLYNLNNKARCVARLNEADAWMIGKQKNKSLDDYGYRYFID